LPASPSEWPPLSELDRCSELDDAVRGNANELRARARTAGTLGVAALSSDAVMNTRSPERWHAAALEIAE
jgi:hypothetical protein